MGSFHKSRVLQSASEFDDNMEKKATAPGVPLVSQFASSLFACWLHGALSPAFRFLLKHFSTLLSRFIFPKVSCREVRRGGARRAGGVQDESSAVFTMWSLRSILLPPPRRPPAPCAASGRRSTVRGCRSGGGASVEEGGSALCRHPLGEDGSESVAMEPK